MQATDQLKNDLDFLLGKTNIERDSFISDASRPASKELEAVTEERKQNKQMSNRKSKTKVVTFDEIRGDMDEIVFSSDEESSTFTKPVVSSKKSKRSKKKTTKAVQSNVPDSEIQKTPTNNKQTKTEDKDVSNIKNAEYALEALKTEFKKDNDGAKKNHKKRNKKTKKAFDPQCEDDSGNDIKPSLPVTNNETKVQTKTPKKKSTKKKSKANLIEGEPVEGNEITTKPQPKKKVSKKSSVRLLDQNLEQTRESNSNENGTISSNNKATLESNEKQSFDSRETTPEGMPFIKLKPVKSTHANKKYSERLPKISPIETIFGLSNEQVYKLKRNDIKIKQIVTQADKSLKNIINFVMNNEHIFEDDNIKNIFVTLCINVALYEAKGLPKTLQKYPNAAELFSKYDELTLTYNNTVFTKSDRKVHDNNFDYTVLSNIGNIIIWLTHVQNLDYVSQKEVKDCFGGFHLWDQLFKEKTINMKRWKHIIKFRLLFPFQQNQFIVIMKFMHVGI